MTNLEIVSNEVIANNLLTSEQVEEMIMKYGSLPFNTYQEWKHLGYQVKKGSKAVIKTKLWKKVNRKEKATDKDGNETEEKRSGFVLVPASLFGADQVEKIAQA